jgi:Fe-Mn family superoxide dismutase
MKLTEKDIAAAISADLGIKKPSVNEAYVVSDRVFDYRTDAIGNQTKQAHQNLLNGYVETLNRVSAELDTANREESNSNDSVFRSLKIDEVYNTNAAFLHGMFFENIAEDSRITADSISFLRLERDFGTFDNWQRDFMATAMAARSGWAVTVYNTFLKRYINVMVDLHSVNVPFSSFPVIVLDVWEHAYYKDYLNDRKKYIFAMMKQLNWKVIDERFQRAEDIAEVFK